jgi:hypothetical protein
MNFLRHWSLITALVPLLAAFSVSAQQATNCQQNGANCTSLGTPPPNNTIGRISEGVQQAQQIEMNAIAIQQAREQAQHQAELDQQQSELIEAQRQQAIQQQQQLRRATDDEAAEKAAEVASQRAIEAERVREERANSAANSALLNDSRKACLAALPANASLEKRRECL